MSGCEVTKAYVRETVAGPTWGCTVKPTDNNHKRLVRNLAKLQRRCRQQLGVAGRISVRCRYMGLGDIGISVGVA